MDESRKRERTPCEEIDDEIAENDLLKETVDKKDKKENSKKKHKHVIIEKSPEENERDLLRCQIDITTYRHRLNNLEEHLNQVKLRTETKLDMELNEMEFERKRRKISQEIELIDSKLELQEKREKYKNIVEKSPDYLNNPIQIDPITGELELILSDRIIELSGPITYSTCIEISDFIYYYNNADKNLPIFLIIDYSPGGSVMSGYRILQAIQTSSAPVYVIVKSFAASMAAMIASMTEHSYIYPNAVILHHQILSKSCGNLRQQQEQVTDMEEWFRRFAGPFVKKLGLTLKQFVKMMYEANSDGDWSEFGDRAVELGWVKGVIHKTRHTGNINKPGKKEIENNKRNDKKRNVEGNDMRLRPRDHWWLYDPDNYYNIR
tara:strand:- start:74 stop:1207 length:1134 start_codon:yes stop_codon:yes gene_type:complete